MRDHLKPILALVATALVFLLYVGYSWALVDFQVQNKSSVGYFQVSKLLGNLYLLREGYFGQVDQVIVIYSDTPQSQNQTFSQVYGGDTLNISYSGSFSGRVYTAEITYRKEIGDKLAQDQDSKWLS